MSGPPDLSGLRREPAPAPERPTIPAPQRRLLTRVGIPVGLLVAFALLLGYAGRDVLTPRVDVRVVPVVPGDSQAAAGDVVAQAAGWVEPDPYPVYASALADGVVDEVLVLEGERVEANQVVAKLVSDDARLALERAEAALADREGGIAFARSHLDAAQRDWDHPIERERAVEEGVASLAEAEASLERLARDLDVQDARIAEIEDDLHREEQQFARKATSEAMVVQAKLRLATAQATRESLVAERSVREAKRDSAKARLDAAKRHLELRIPETKALAEAKAALRQAEAERDRAQAARDEAKLRHDRMSVRAPSAGIVMRRLAAPGAKVMLAMDDMHSAHIVHLYDPQKLQVRVDVPLADASAVGVNQLAEVFVEVLPDRMFRGRVTRVVHEADIQKNTLQVKVEIQEPDAELKPEMLARVRFLGRVEEGETAETRYYVPEPLLVDAAGNRAAVWIVNEGDRAAERRDLRLSGAKREGWVEVTSGVRAGDRVIDARGIELSDGRRVAVVGEVEERSWR